MARNYSLSAYSNRMDREERAAQLAAEQSRSMYEGASNRQQQSFSDLMRQLNAEEMAEKQHGWDMERQELANQPHNRQIDELARQFYFERTGRDDFLTLPEEHKEKIRIAAAEVIESKQKADIATNTMTTEQGNLGTSALRGTAAALEKANEASGGNVYAAPYNEQPQAVRSAMNIAKGLGTEDNRFNAAAMGDESLSMLDAKEGAGVGPEEMKARRVGTDIEVSADAKYQADAMVRSQQWAFKMQEQRSVSSFQSGGFVYLDRRTGNYRILNRQAAEDIGVQNSDALKAITSVMNTQAKKIEQLRDIATDVTKRSAAARKVINEGMSPGQIHRLVVAANPAGDPAQFTNKIVEMAASGDLDGALTYMANNLEQGEGLAAAQEWGTNLMRALLAATTQEGYLEPVGPIPPQVAEDFIIHRMPEQAAIQKYRDMGGTFSNETGSEQPKKEDRKPSVIPGSGGEQTVVLQDGTVIPMP